MNRKNGVHLWKFEADNGAIIQKVYSFLACYTSEKMSYQQIKDPDKTIENHENLSKNTTYLFALNVII